MPRILQPRDPATIVECGEAIQSILLEAPHSGVRKQVMGIALFNRGYRDWHWYRAFKALEASGQVIAEVRLVKPFSRPETVYRLAPRRSA